MLISIIFSSQPILEIITYKINKLSNCWFLDENGLFYSSNVGNELPPCAPCYSRFNPGIKQIFVHLILISIIARKIWPSGCVFPVPMMTQLTRILSNSILTFWFLATFLATFRLLATFLATFRLLAIFSFVQGGALRWSHICYWRDCASHRIFKPGANLWSWLCWWC